MAARDDRPRADRPRIDDADQSRRTLIRGAALVGLAGVAGFPLAGCGGGDDATGALGGSETGATAGAGAEAATAAPNPNRKATKSDVYKRTPEPRPERTKVPKGEPTAEVTASPTTAQAGGKGPGSKGGDNLATARKGEPADPDATAGRKPKKTAKPTVEPEPLAPGALVRAEDIPVGGGKAFAAEKIVVTQPTKGTFKGFSAKCTHTGCLIDKVAEGAIICPCHGSRFGISDGAVQKGPAMLALPAEPISVDTRGNISRG